MRIFVTGATGSIGRRFVADRVRRGDRLRLLTRDRDYARAVFAGVPAASIDIIEGDPTKAGPWQLALDGCGTVVHLAGSSIAARRWSARVMREIRDSRVRSAERLVEAIARASHRPRVLISASGVHASSGRSGAPVTERDGFGSGFLADVCREWEAAASGARAHGVRAILLRIPMVLDPEGAALRLLDGYASGTAVPFLRAVPCIGAGSGPMPWIHHADLVAILAQAIEDPVLDGPILATAPRPATARGFAEAYAAAHPRRPWVLPVPRPLARLALGRMADEIAAPVDARPLRLLARSFTWRFDRLDEALADCLAPSAAPIAAAGEQPAPPRAAIVDLDHDALDAHGALLPDAATILGEVRARLILVPASRRPAAELPARAHEAFQGAPALLAGGAVLQVPSRDGAEGSTRRATIPPPLLARILGDVAELDPRVGVIFERADGYATPHAERLREVRRGRALPHAEEREVLGLVAGETLRLHICDDVHGLDIVERWLRDRYAQPGLVRLSHPSQGILTVSPAGSDLAGRRAEIAAILGIPPEETAIASTLSELRTLAGRA